MFLKELDAELKDVKGGTREGARRWPRKMLLELVSEIAVLSNKVKGTGRKWTVVTSLLVAVYRDEMGKKKAVDRYNSSPSSEPTKP